VILKLITQSKVVIVNCRRLIDNESLSAVVERAGTVTPGIADGERVGCADGS